MPRFVHRSSGALIEGTRVNLDEILSDVCVYDSRDGTWHPCPEELVGSKLRDDESVWVRVEHHDHSLVVQGQNPQSDLYGDGCPVHAPSRLQ